VTRATIGWLAWGAVDAHSVRGSTGVSVPWVELAEPAPGTARAFRQLFGRRDPTFRRLDSMSRALVLAVEAAGVSDVLDAAARDETALVVETRLGCLDADLRFAQTLGGDMVDGPLFAYTLPSTCLGEVALRHGLRGPSLCLSVIGPAAAGSDRVEDPGSLPGAAVREALAMLEEGSCTHAVAAVVEVLGAAHGNAAAALEVAAVLMGPGGRPLASTGCDAWNPWLPRDSAPS